MANIEKLAPFILSWEGGYVNNPNDRGGATNKGVTLATWRSVGYDKDGDGDIDVADLKLISDAEVVSRVMKPYYWDKVGGDQINDQGIANMLADWAYMSGAARPARTIQSIVGAKVDGKIGPKTIAAINGYKDQEELFKMLRSSRVYFYENIVRQNPSQKVFLRGWLNRLAAMSWRQIICNGGKIITW